LLEGTIAVHRADLQGALAAAAGEVRLAVEVVSVEPEGDGVLARFADGGEERCDLLVGADGLSSVVRGAIADVPPRYAGYTAWRGVCSVPVEPGRLTESWGFGERFGLVDIGRERTYWFATKNAPERGADEPEGRKAEVVRRFSGRRSGRERLRRSRRPSCYPTALRGAATSPPGSPTTRRCAGPGSRPY